MGANQYSYIVVIYKLKGGGGMHFINFYFYLYAKGIESLPQTLIFESLYLNNPTGPDIVDFTQAPSNAYISTLSKF